MNYKVLIADDNRDTLNSYRYQLKQYTNIRPTLVTSAEEAVKLVESSPYDFAAVVLDFHFENKQMNGADLARQLLDLNKDLRIIICTGDNSNTPAIASLKARVHDYVSKDDVDGFITSLESCFPIYDEFIRIIGDSNHTDDEKMDDNQSYMKKFGMISRSQKMRNICEIIEQAKDDKATVLVRGESGTGKELIARALHFCSDRKEHEFIALNCAAIPNHLLESELFGYERGAFTGATSSKVGQIELAHNGTLFLDEIGDLPLELQAKLLRAIQEGSFFRVGGKNLIKVNIRIVAATNVDLKKAMDAGRFREDLYYRLNVIRIELPPLRERKEDIESLVQHFQNKYRRHTKKRILHKTLKFLESYNWPGNIRELENTVESMFAISRTDEIGPEYLPQYIFDDLKTENQRWMSAEESDYPTFYNKLTRYVEEREYEFLNSKLIKFKSLRKTAEKLNIPKTSLQRKLARKIIPIDNTAERKKDFNV